MTISRRVFLKTSSIVSGGLLMGVAVPGMRAMAEGLVHTPNAWVHIADDNTITLLSARSEMGQGVYTSMPMLLAEELHVQIQKVRVAIAPPNPKLYGNALLGGLQLTGGSTSVRDGWERLRIAGAQVREMLISAAAARWSVDPGTLKAVDGMVVGPNNRKASYGELAADASKLPVPEKVAIKDPKDFTIVGKRTRRLDTPAKVNGSAQFGIDVTLPGMVYAALEQCPVIGGKVKSFDATAAKAMPGVISVVEIPDGVAVVANSWWRANMARKALTITWDEGPSAGLNEKAMQEGLKAASMGANTIKLKAEGDADAVIAASKRVVRADYASQMLSHSPLEPMNFTAHFDNGKVMLIGSTQWQDAAQGKVAAALGVPPENVSVQTTFLGGGFGRRIDVDFIVQAAQISKAVGKPVKLVWSREDDMTHDFYRPRSLHAIAAAVGDDGNPTAMTFRLTSQSVTGRIFGLPAEAPDAFMTEAAVAGYDIPASRYDVIKHDVGLRVGYWRSVSHALNAFANESFMDELAAAAGKDPYAYRLGLLRNQPRMANVLQRAAEKAGWGTPLPQGRARGIAVMEGYGTFLAGVAEISLDRGAISVHRFTVVADVGQMVNPDTVEAQVQSGVVFGMGPALMQEITLKNGRVEQTNFHQFPLVRMYQTPVIDVELVQSTQAPGGIGEPSTALVAPAVANALYALTGKRLRKLPMTADAIAQA